eukprot:TRINITY_DN2647_c0_g1_i1.p1 TRINITY_DN2647_c0_g1~~TRINITY_DN2647_c0_g1_i1.p1  ORF type:complete len:358 (+),score=73.73 TRINITY_DN2647_c0_g1_i1:80-1153(+)
MYQCDKRPGVSLATIGTRNLVGVVPPLVTGANSGLGRAITEELAVRLHCARVVMACRPKPTPGETPAEEVRVQLRCCNTLVWFLLLLCHHHDSQVAAIITAKARAAGSSCVVEVVPLELADARETEENVRKMARDGLPRFHVVFLNAGVAMGKYLVTPQGFEYTIGINYVGNFVLVRTLLECDLLCTPNRHDGQYPRIVGVASEAHRIAPPLFKCIHGLHKPTPLTVANSMTAYGTSKLLLLAFLGELRRRHPNVTVCALCPGAMATNIAHTAPRGFLWAVRLMMWAFFKEPDHAALPVVRLARLPVAGAATGVVYRYMFAEADVRDDARDPGLCRLLWDTTVELLRANKEHYLTLR